MCYVCIVCVCVCMCMFVSFAVVVTFSCPFFFFLSFGGVVVGRGLGGYFCVAAFVSLLKICCILHSGNPQQDWIK